MKAVFPDDLPIKDLVWFAARRGLVVEHASGDTVVFGKAEDNVFRFERASTKTATVSQHPTFDGPPAA